MTPIEIIGLGLGWFFVIVVLHGVCCPTEVKMTGDPCKLCLTLFDREIDCECGANKHFLDD